MRRAAHRARLCADPHFRQKWRVVWRQLAQLPRRGLRLLDAGCGDGRWSIEIALRRPEWIVVGLDRDRAHLDRAAALRRSLAIPNADFIAGDFLAFRAASPFDVVLAVCSTHYGRTDEESERLFARIREWLRPGGCVVLLQPRCRTETPFASRLGAPAWHDQFSAAALRRLCDRSDLQIDRLNSCIGRMGVVAKQLDWHRGRLAEPVKSAVRLVALGLAAVDARLPEPRRRSLMWLLVGHRPA
ncbi:MAG TPA: class I SAM-dependent methyltransferase [Vicinamibacterales bacterium]|nr:class I SAM-dependent methyltransferase [Vicinamibacterales bacterium]